MHVKSEHAATVLGFRVFPAKGPRFSAKESARPRQSIPRFEGSCTESRLSDMPARHRFRR